MQVVCIHIPRNNTSDVAAIQQVEWEIFPARLFCHQLDNLVESIWEPFSLELYATRKMFYVCMAGSERMIDILTTGIYSWLPDGDVQQRDDYTTQVSENTMVVGAEAHLWRPDIYPLKDYRNMATNSMASIAAPLHQVPDTDQVVYQIVVRPLKDNASLHLDLARQRFQERFVRGLRIRSWLKKDLPVNSVDLIRNKCSRNLVMASVRVAALTEVPLGATKQERERTFTRLSEHVRGIGDALRTFNTQDENRILLGPIESGPRFAKRLSERRFCKPFKLSTIELASLFHPPALGALPNTATVLSKKTPPPPNLPTTFRDAEVSTFGTVNFRDLSTRFGIKRSDRRGHTYIVGKSGSGKSCLMQLLVQKDMERGYGCAVIDPHGDLIDDLLRMVPKHRIKDVVVFDPSDLNYPISFNPMAPFRPEFKLRVATSFLDAFKRVFGDDWSQKMDHVLRYAMLGLSDLPGSNVVSLRRMLSDETFRGEVVRRATDESVKRFWLREFPARRREFEEGAISRLLNRLDDLLANQNIRRILEQEVNTLNFRSFMDSGKLVFIKISKGVLGSQSATLLGTLLIWKIYEAAMSRADTAAESRKDFYLYIDEFQNFASNSLTEILSESRKYNLCLTFANQYLGQLTDSIRSTIFGNVANLLSFRVGAEDARILAQEFQPNFSDEDLINLPVREFYLKMSIDGQVQSAFSGRTVTVQPHETAESHVEECIKSSREAYSRPTGVISQPLGVAGIAI